RDPRSLHLSPTRRSSDLRISVLILSKLIFPFILCVRNKSVPLIVKLNLSPLKDLVKPASTHPNPFNLNCPSTKGLRYMPTISIRSEEHTSELQSRENLVC